MIATANSHRVFDAIRGLWPVTFDNVREADPQGLLDIFEGAENTRDAYFEAVATMINATQAGHRWAIEMREFDTDHDDECERETAGEWECHCKIDQYENNQQWGIDLWQAIQQRIQELND